MQSREILDQQVLNAIFSSLPQEEVREIIRYPNRGNKEGLCVIMEREGYDFYLPPLDLKSFSIGETTFMSPVNFKKRREKNDPFVKNLKKGRSLFNRWERRQ